MKVSDTWKLKELAEENQRLKQMYADLKRKHEVLKNAVDKKDRLPEPVPELLGEPCSNGMSFLI